MDHSATALTYTKMAGFATTHGQEFEWTLAALLHLRGLNSGLNFQLGTNVKGAGAMDDIVFCLEHDGAWRTTYVQLKHKENATVYRNMLTNPKGDFSLPTYFKSYPEIQKTMSTETRETLFKGSLEDCLFVIFTNAAGPKCLGEKISEGFSQVEELLWSGSGSIFNLGKDEEMLECLGEHGEDGRQFLKQLRLFCGQPRGEKLKAAVKDELRKMEKYKIKDLNIDRLCECFLGNVKAWCEKRGTKNDILHKGHNILESAFERVSRESEIIEDKTRLLTTSEQTLKDFGLDLEFEVTALNEFANGLSTVSHVVSSEGSCRLTLTKLWQASESQSLLLKIEHLIPYKRVLLEECLQGNVKRLVVFADKDWPSDLSELNFEIVYDIVKGKNKCSVVFLSDGNNSQVSALTARFPGGVKSHADNFYFSQLKEVSRNVILGKPVKLQDHDTTLGDLLTKDCKFLDQVLNAPLAWHILRREGPLKVGSALPEGIDYYVGRTLEQALCVKASAFKALHETVCIRITQSEASFRGLLEKAFEFLSSLKDYPSFNQTDLRQTINKLVQTLAETDSQGLIGPKSSFFNQGDLREIINKQSTLDPNENDCQVSIETKFALGMYECNFVGLRCGKENAVTALRVCSSKEASQQVSFLFVDMETKADDVSKLTEFYDVRHLIDFKDGQLRWIRSHGGIESIRKHIDEDHVSRFAPETAMDIEERLMLVCAEPGMGKSTLMARLAKNTKEDLPHYFVFLISLNDYTKLFAEGKHKNALEFLSIAAKMDSPLQRSLLKFALEVSGNVVVIADGFDEIAPRYVKECCHLLSRLLKETKARKIWMTSRNSVKQTIETHFSKFSSKLREFDKEGQKKFFKTFWNTKSKLSMSELDTLIDEVLDKSSKAIPEREENFLGIPLQCQILAEVFEDHVNDSCKNAKLPDKLDLISLLEMFVDKKCKVFVENKLKISFDNTNYEDLLKDAKKKFIDSHSKAGLVLILSENELKTLGLEQVIKEWSAFCKEIQLGKDKTGFIDEIINDKPRFIHRVFAEYFVASWISQHLADSAKLIKSKMFTADFAVIRHIFNGILGKGFDLHTAVLQENEDKVKTLLESEDVETQDSEGRTALHLAAGLGTSEDQEENKRRVEILDLIIGKTRDFKVVDKVLCGSPLRYAVITQTWVAIDKLLCKTDDNGELGLTLENVGDENMLAIIFQQDLDKLLGLCLDRGLEVEHQATWRGRRLLHRACEEGSFKVASLLIERNAEIKNIEVKEVSPLMAASRNGHLEIVKLLVRKFSSCTRPSHDNNTLLLLTGCTNGEVTNFQEPTSKYINMKSWDGKTAMHYAAREGHEDVISFLLSQGGDPQSRDVSNRTPLHLAAWDNRPNVMKVLLQAWDELDRNEIADSMLVSPAGGSHAKREGMTLQEYIDLKDKDGNTVMHHVALGSSVECIELLLQAGGRLTQVGSNGRTPLMTAARKDQQEVVKWLLDNFNVGREGMTLQEYIGLQDKDGNNVMHHAAWGGSVECMKLLLQTEKKFSEVGWNGETPLMTAARFGKQDIVKCLLDNFNAGREGMTLQEYIDLTGNNGNTVMYHAAWGGSAECVKLLLQAGGKMSEVGWDEKTLLMKAAIEGKQEVVKCLLDNFNVEREGMTLQEYIDLKDKDGDTAIHLAAWGGSVGCIELLLLAGGKNFQLGYNGQTPLMIAAGKVKQEVVKCLLDKFNAETEGITLQEYIYLKDKDANNAIHLAALKSSEECLKLLLQAGGKLCQEGFKGQTPLMTAASEGHQEMVKWLLDEFNAEREGMTLQEYIYLIDNDGNTAIHLAALQSSEECLKLLLQAGGKLCQESINGETSLMIAAGFGKEKVVKCLLGNFNAEREGMTLQEYINLKDKIGNTAMHISAYKRSEECLKLLLEAGGKLTGKGFNGKTSLMIAADFGKEKNVKWLLGNFIAEREGMTLQEYINLKDKIGNTAMHISALKRSKECLKLLLQAGGKLTEKGFNGKTSLMIAADFGKEKVVKWLLRNFIAEREGMTLQEYINLQDRHGNTVMHLAVKGRLLECVVDLIKAGGKFSQLLFKGETLLMAAVREGILEVVKCLLRNFNAEREAMTLQEYIELENKFGENALHLADQADSFECIVVLIAAGAKICQIQWAKETLLMKAARGGKQKVVKCILDNFIAGREGMTLQQYIDLKDKDGDTAMHYACWGGSVQCIEPILKAGGMLSQVDFSGHSPLMIAVGGGKHEVVEWLFDMFNVKREGITLREYIDLKDKEGNTVLYLAACGGSIGCLKQLLQFGWKLSETGLNRETPMMAAARCGKHDVIECLLFNFHAKKEVMTLQEYIELENKFGENALHLADQADSFECIVVLIAAGARICQIQWAKETLLMKAARGGKQEVVKCILDNFNADREGMTLQQYIDLKDKDGDTAMHYAALEGSVEIVKLLLLTGRKLSEIGWNGETVLMKAGRGGKQKVVKCILDNFNAGREGMTLQEYIDIKDKEGNNVLHLAAWGDFVECVRLLVQAGGKVSQVDLNGQTLLMKAASFCKQEVVKCLLDTFNVYSEGMTLQAYIDLEDNEGHTVMYFAGLGGSLECIKLLLKAGGKMSQIGGSVSVRLIL